MPFRFRLGVLPWLVGALLTNQCFAAGPGHRIRVVADAEGLQIRVQGPEIEPGTRVGPDQLRQRVSFALGQIWVVSATKMTRADQMIPYLRLLHSLAFSNYHFVGLHEHGRIAGAAGVGGAVKGGEVYGTYPTMALGGPDDATGRGVWVPTTSLDQYGATLASWFGVPTEELTRVFPNLTRFGPTRLGFMG